MDPMAGAAAKAAGSAADETGKLLNRVLGPSADEIGEALRRYTKFRVRNIGRIAEKAEQKAQGRSGEVPPRVAHKLLEDGSYCDDELMAEYLSGVLAAGRTRDGRDDRAIVWSNLVTSMSSIQLRTHLLLYREWAIRLRGHDECSPDAEEGRSRSRMLVDVEEFFRLLDPEAATDSWQSLLNHTVGGLERVGLLHSAYEWRSWRPGQGPSSEWPYRGTLKVMPASAGVELYGWAQGYPGMTGAAFVRDAQPLALEELGRLTSARIVHYDA